MVPARALDGAHGASLRQGLDGQPGGSPGPKPADAVGRPGRNAARAPPSSIVIVLRAGGVAADGRTAFGAPMAATVRLDRRMLLVEPLHGCLSPTAWSTHSTRAACGCSWRSSAAARAPRRVQRP